MQADAERKAGLLLGRAVVVCDFHGLQAPKGKFMGGVGSRLLVGLLLLSIKVVMRADTVAEAQQLLDKVCAYITDVIPDWYVS